MQPVHHDDGGFLFLLLSGLSLGHRRHSCTHHPRQVMVWPAPLRGESQRGHKPPRVGHSHLDRLSWSCIVLGFWLVTNTTSTCASSPPCVAGVPVVTPWLPVRWPALKPESEKRMHGAPTRSKSLFCSWLLAHSCKSHRHTVYSGRLTWPSPGSRENPFSPSRSISEEKRVL